MLKHEARAHFPFLATNIVETATGVAPPWVTPSTVVLVNSIKVGVIGAELQSTPELVSAGNTAGLTFLPEAQRIKEESERLRKLGVRVQVVVIHQGTAPRREPRSATRRATPGKGRSWASPTSCRARPSTR